MARAEALLRQGCYECLRTASDVYAHLIDPPVRRPSPSAIRAAFEVSVLLAVREKEIGLDSAASLSRARTLLGKLSEQSPPDRRGASRADLTRSKSAVLAAPDPAMLLHVAEGFFGELSGLDAEARQDQARAAEQRGSLADAERQLQQAFEESGGTALAAGYLALALDCEQPVRDRLVSPAGTLARADAPPLLRYRAAICSQDRPRVLNELREQDPRWTEAYFFEGKYEMGSPSRPPVPARAAPLFASARDTFPTSIAVHVLLARAQEMEGDAAAALASFDAVLALQPAHVDAQLGRVRTLSSLGRHEEAVATASALIERGTWYVGDAYYWRAWNQYSRRQLDAAWADVQGAMRLVANTSVYTLAGSIAHARRELETAVGHFDTAWTMDATNCFAASSGGLVEIDRGDWKAAADRFSNGVQCYAVAAGMARAELASIENASLDPGERTRRLATTRKRWESAEELGAQSALNAAQAYVQVGERERALAFVERAERHVSTRNAAGMLRVRIAGVR
jgi:tetratricopeptide (TPR) repeat protein